MRTPTALRRNWVLTTCLVLVGAVLCVRLGIWQLDRLAQRRGFNEHVRSMQSLPTVNLPSDLDLASQEFRPVRASGTFDFAHQIAVRNQVHDGEYGYHLLAPLNLGSTTSADGTAVLVDRGWIPAEGNTQSEDWRQYDTSGPAEVVGVIRLGQDSPTFGGIAQPTPAAGEGLQEFWMYIDLASIDQQLPYALLPVYIQAAAEGDPLVPPIASIPRLDLTEGPHQGYALQWFTFSALLLVGYPFYLASRSSGKQ